MDQQKKNLWAPWRLSYVATPKPAAGDECFICTKLAEENDRENLIVLRTELSVVFLNRFPYNNGHLLIAPREHKGRLTELTDAHHLDMTHIINRFIDIMDEEMHPEGYNIGLNLGQAAGAGLPGHLHWHVVPRWNGDTNFMPIVADVKVIVQSLESLYDILARRLQEDCDPE